MTINKTIITLLSGALSISSVLAQDTASRPKSLPLTNTPPINGAATGGADIAEAPPFANGVRADDLAGSLAVVNLDEVSQDLSLMGASHSQPNIGDGGLVIEDANINDVFQLLAKSAGKQYFHNNKLSNNEYRVTGHLNAGAGALKQMEELAFQYGLRMYEKGNTVYAMLDDQLQRLPAKEWTYSLNYLRPTDINQIKALVTPMLSPGRGIVNYEPKTNTVIVIDTMRHIEMVERLLKKIDQPKGQIAIEVQILRVNRSTGKHSGVDWSSSLGNSGVSLDVARSLSSVFGISGDFAGAFSSGSASEISSGNLILSPFEVNGVLKALNDSELVSKKSNPIVITEDNENAIISLIDRIPIITSTVNSASTTTTTTEEVRYKIDESDSTDPETTREVGVTISMTPSLLPDGTIRMKMRPRNAEIVEYIEGATGNQYPRVSEATIETIARIPNGHSLVIGGFYGESDLHENSEVPFLSKLPLLNFFFKSKGDDKERSSLVFIVTPTSYDPANVRKSNRMSSHVNDHLRLDAGYAEAEHYHSSDEKGSSAAQRSGLKSKLKNLRSRIFSRR